LFFLGTFESPLKNGNIMTPPKTKPLLVILIIVSVISVITNMVLVLKLHQASEKAAKWNQIQASLTSKISELENRLDTHKQEFKIQGRVHDARQPGKRSKPSGQLTPSSTQLPNQPDEDFENSADAYREDIQAMLSEAIYDGFPDLNLNQAEIEELTDTVITIRESMEDLRSMVRSSDTVETIKELQQQRDLAMLDFERITGVNVMEFMRHAPGEGGIDYD
jgi:hypothetical protein